MRKLLYTPIALLLCSAFIGCSEDAPLPDPDPVIPDAPADTTKHGGPIICLTSNRTIAYGIVAIDSATDLKVFNPYEIGRVRVEDDMLGKELYVIPDSITFLPVGNEFIGTYILDLLDCRIPNDTINGIIYHHNGFYPYNPPDYEEPYQR